MNEFDELRDTIAARPGAEERIEAEVERMTQVLELYKLRAGIPQSELAERMGVSQRRVSAIEHAGPEIRIDTLRRYVESLGGVLEITAVIDGARISLPIS